MHLHDCKPNCLESCSSCIGTVLKCCLISPCFGLATVLDYQQWQCDGHVPNMQDSSLNRVQICWENTCSRNLAVREVLCLLHM